MFKKLLSSAIKCLSAQYTQLGLFNVTRKCNRKALTGRPRAISSRRVLTNFLLAFYIAVYYIMTYDSLEDRETFRRKG